MFLREKGQRAECGRTGIFDVTFAADSDMMLPFPELELFSEPQETQPDTDLLTIHRFKQRGKN